MARIGLDFGTTYSIVAYLDDQSEPKVINFGGEGRPVQEIETLFVDCSGDDEEDFRIGPAAVKSIRMRGAITYDGFKMLLCSENKALLKARGYIEKSPDEVTRLFLSELFKKVAALPEYTNTRFDTIVVGVPYVWTNNGEESRKSKLIEIIKEVTKANQVEFKTEPTLACAYFVDKINKKREKNYDGYILVIDYGGGTLDITLCKAGAEHDQCTIEVCNSWGAGENTDGTIGKAGLSYMEKVADILLEDDGISEINKKAAEYQKFKKDIECEIIDMTEYLRRKFKRDAYCREGGEEFNREVSGNPIDYNGAQYYIKYGTLVRAYNTVIRGVLHSVLNKAKDYMDANNIPYNDYEKENFKIAMIGGFCRFALTEKQIHEDTDWLKVHARNDARYTDLDIISLHDREFAIAYGAALNANDVVSIKRQFPYTLCFFGETQKEDENGMNVRIPNEKEEFIVFRENEEYIPGKPVFLGFEETDKNGMIVFRRLPVYGNRIPYIQRRKNGKISLIKEPSRLMELPDDKDIYLAIAMEVNENLTLYIYDQAEYNQLTAEEQNNAENKALIGRPTKLPNIDTLLAIK